MFRFEDIPDVENDEEVAGELIKPLLGEVTFLFVNERVVAFLVEDTVA